MKIRILILVAAILLFTACSVETTVKEPSAVKPATETEESVSEKSEESEKTAEPEESKEATEEEEPEESTESEESSQTEDMTIEETVLLDEAGVRITAKKLDLSDLFGPALKLLIENESGKDLTFQCGNASVNGFMIETMMSADIVNGKKANEDLTFMASDLERCGITTIADMEISFHIYDTDEWEDYLNTEPVQLLTAAADSYKYNYEETGQLAYEDDDISIRILGLSEDEYWGPVIRVSIVNKGSRNLTVQTQDVSIEGFMVEPMFSCDVLAEKRAIDDVTFMESELEDNGIEQITSAELSFHIFDMDTWDDLIDTEPVVMEWN